MKINNATKFRLEKQFLKQSKLNLLSKEKKSNLEAA